MEIRDIVTIDYGVISDEMMLITEVSPVYTYENGKRTGEIQGYKGTFLVSSGEYKGLQVQIKVGLIDPPAWELMSKYDILYDREKSKVYTQNGRIQASLWATSVIEVG